MTGKASSLSAILALPYVAAANVDMGVTGAPVDAVQVSSFAGGLGTWDQDAINVTRVPLSSARIAQTG